MSLTYFKMALLSLAFSALPNLPLSAATGDALQDAMDRQICGTGVVVRAEYLDDGVLYVLCRGGPVTNTTTLGGTALGGAAAGAVVAGLIVIAIVVGDSSDGATSSSTTTTASQ